MKLFGYTILIFKTIDEKLEVLNYVSKSYGVTPIEIRGKSKERKIVKARHEVMRLLKLGYTCEEVGAFLNKTHSSVTYATNKEYRLRKKINMILLK